MRRGNLRKGRGLVGKFGGVNSCRIVRYCEKYINAPTNANPAMTAAAIFHTLQGRSPAASPVWALIMKR